MNDRRVLIWRGLLPVFCAVMLGVAAAASAQDKRPTDEEVQKMTEALPEKATVKPARPRKLLIFCRTEGFNHSAIPYGAKALELMGKQTGAYESVISDDMAMFEPETLEQFDAVVFNNTVSLKFEDPRHRQALIDFVHGGKGMIGIHGGADNFKNWPEGAAMMGAVFTGHPWGRCPTKLDDPDHPLLKAFGGKGFTISDEMYKFGGPYSREKLRVLLSMDAAKGDPDKRGREDGDNAVAWIQQVGQGRTFYCSLGHQHQIFWNPVLLQFYLDGVQYALGDLKADATPSAELDPQPKPAMPPDEAK
ncbi:MAG TPA: ThuA domain-containing protein [Thermoguttaceae bacterium]|nr:ThuA domain-containing protein [Thermoguttaceae bacterium]